MKGLETTDFGAMEFIMSIKHAGARGCRLGGGQAALVCVSLCFWTSFPNVPAKTVSFQKRRCPLCRAVGCVLAGVFTCVPAVCPSSSHQTPDSRVPETGVLVGFGQYPFHRVGTQGTGRLRHFLRLQNQLVAWVPGLRSSGFGHRSP